MQNKFNVVVSTFDNAVISTSSKTYWGGLGYSVYGFLRENENAVFIGVVIGIIGLLLNAIFQWRRDRREQKAFDNHQRREDEKHDAALQMLGKSNNTLEEITTIMREKDGKDFKE